MDTQRLNRCLERIEDQLHLDQLPALVNGGLENRLLLDSFKYIKFCLDELYTESTCIETAREPRIFNRLL